VKQDMCYLLTLTIASRRGRGGAPPGWVQETVQSRAHTLKRQLFMGQRVCIGPCPPRLSACAWLLPYQCMLTCRTLWEAGVIHGHQRSQLSDRVSRRAQDARGGRAAREAALRAEHTQLGEQAALLAARIEVRERRPRVPVACIGWGCSPP